MKTEVWKNWAPRVAQLITDEQWREGAAFIARATKAGWSEADTIGPGGYSFMQWMQLAARVREIAASLSKHERRMLKRGHASRGPSGDKLWLLGLATASSTTPLGRIVLEMPDGIRREESEKQ